MKRLRKKYGYLAVLSGCFAALLLIFLLTQPKSAAQTPQTSPVPSATPAPSPQSAASPAPAATPASSAASFSLLRPCSGELLRDYAEGSLNYDATLCEYSAHAATDFGESGSDAVWAAAQGTVTAIRSHAAYGLTVELTHRGGYITRYGSLSSCCVSVGERVTAGQPLGTMGECAGECALGKHLHFSLWQLSQSLNAADFYAE